MNWFVYVCPYCGRQYRGPGAHSMAGDDRATSCFHRHPGERGVTQPSLVRIEIDPGPHFTAREVPHDGPSAARMKLRVDEDELPIMRANGPADFRWGAE